MKRVEGSLDTKQILTVVEKYSQALGRFNRVSEDRNYIRRWRKRRYDTQMS